MVSNTVKKDLSKKEVRAALLEDAPSQAQNHRGRGRTEAEKREIYARYNKIKKRVIELEERNKRFLILFPASDATTNLKHTFYNMGGTSAIIYCHEIGPRIKRKPTLRRDMDNGRKEEKFHTGICSIADLAALKNALSEIGIEQFETKDPDLIFFKLKRDYPRFEVREMLKQEQKRLDELNKLLYADVLHPDIHKLILDLKRLIPAKVKNMDKTYRQVVGMRMIDSLMSLIQLYSRMVHGDMEEKEAAKEMMLVTDDLLGQVSLINELKLWEVTTCVRMGNILIGLRKLIKGKILNKK